MSQKPTLEFTEQPQASCRFRYKSEKQTHGVLQGVNSSKNFKSFPTVKLSNYSKKTVLKCCLVEDAYPHKKHRHQLLFQDREQIEVEVEPPNYEFSWRDLTIIFNLKKSVAAELMKERRAKRLPCDKVTIQNLLDKINLDVVRLRVSAHEPTSLKELCNCISDPIYNLKSARTNDLKIVRMSRRTGSVKGGDVIFICCEKVKREDIKVIFTLTNKYEEVLWTEYADMDLVHKQYTLIVNTPQFMDVCLTKDQDVRVQLYRPSNDSYSDPETFTYLADEALKCHNAPCKKRRSTSSYFDECWEDELTIHENSTELPKQSAENNSATSNVISEIQRLMHEDLDPLLSEQTAIRSAGQPKIEDFQSDLEDFRNTLESMGDSDVDLYDLDFQTSPLGSFLERANIDKSYIRTDGPNPDSKEYVSEFKRMNLDEKRERFTNRQLKRIDMLFGQLLYTDTKNICSLFSELLSIENDDGHNIIQVIMLRGVKEPTLKEIIQQLKNKNSIDLLNVRRNGSTFMHFAIEHGLEEELKTLLEHGLNPFVKDRNGNNALHLAVHHGRYLDLILEHTEANHLYDERNNDGQTPLGLAQCLKDDEAVTKIIAKRSNLDTIKKEPFEYCEEFYPDMNSTIELKVEPVDEDEYLTAPESDAEDFALKLEVEW